MIRLSILCIYAYSSLANADLPGVSFFKPNQKRKRSIAVERTKESLPRKKQVKRRHSNGNLPHYYNSTSNDVSSTLTVYSKAPKSVGRHFGLEGEYLDATLDGDVLTATGLDAPVRAIVTTPGRWYGAIALAQGRLEGVTKRLTAVFKTLKVGGFSYSIDGTLHDERGAIGVEGDFQSKDDAYFAGELISATAAGFTDATVNRSQTAFGGYQDEPSLGNAAKKGLASALGKTAERFGERAKRAPSVLKVQSNTRVRILFIKPVKRRG